MKTFGKVVLFSVLGLMVAGAGVGCWLKWDTIVSDINAHMGDYEKVSFNQAFKVADLTLVVGTNNVKANKDNCFVYKHTGTTVLSDSTGFYTNRYNNAVVTYRTFEIASSNTATKFGYSDINGSIEKENVFQRCVAFQDARKVDGTPDYENSAPIVFSALPNDVITIKNYMDIDLTNLGITEEKKAIYVWEKLAGSDYFEGEKSFTKGQIKKAIKDYDDEQEKLTAASSAATSSAAAA